MQLERQAEVEERQAQADIAVKQAEARHKMALAQQQQAHEERMAQMQFEFDKKLELLKLWAKSKADAQQRNEEQTGAKGSEAADVDFENLLKSEGADIPAQMETAPTPLEKAMQQVAESQAQLAQMMAQIGQQMASGQQENTKLLASAVMETAKPKRQRVVRDDKNRVIGVDTVQ
jgi:hypothetical protein